MMMLYAPPSWRETLGILNWNDPPLSNEYPLYDDLGEGPLDELR